MPKPRDFTESAVNLSNPPEVGEKLTDLSQVEVEVRDLEATLEENETYKLLREKLQLVETIKAQIKDMVDALGSYQDIEKERYAIKYARKSKVYNLEPFMKHFPKFVELCVKQTIDVTALEGQVKGKLITEEELEKKGVLEYSESYAFYIR